MKLLLEKSSRAYLEEMRALTTDDTGREVFVGLSREESEEFAHLTELLQNQSDIERRRYLELHEKHEAIRVQVVGAEAEARTSPGQKH